MPEFPLIVCYYTRDTLYQLEVQNLIASCEKWGLKYHVESIASLGSWEKNCSFKPFFLLEKLQQFQKPLFWVDADAEFVASPRWLDVFDHDLAVRMNKNLADDHPSKVISNSFFVNATLAASNLLKAWGQECIDSFLRPGRTEEVWDQMTLRDVILKKGEIARVAALPLEYAAIADHPEDQQIKNIVIAHYQASRRFKQMINHP